VLHNLVILSILFTFLLCHWAKSFAAIIHISCRIVIWTDVAAVFAATVHKTRIALALVLLSPHFATFEVVLCAERGSSVFVWAGGRDWIKFESLTLCIIRGFVRRKHALNLAPSVASGFQPKKRNFKTKILRTEQKTSFVNIQAEVNYLVNTKLNIWNKDKSKNIIKIIKIRHLPAQIPSHCSPNLKSMKKVIKKLKIFKKNLYCFW
jgi:hypothetical protein